MTKVFIASSDLAWAMEMNAIPGADTRLAVNPVDGDYGFFSFGDRHPPGWFDCGPLPQYPIYTVRANIAREFFPKSDWQDCREDQLPADVAAQVEEAAFLRAWRQAAFMEDYTPFSAEESPINGWIAALAERDIEVKLTRG